MNSHNLITIIQLKTRSYSDLNDHYNINIYVIVLLNFSRLLQVCLICSEVSKTLQSHFDYHFIDLWRALQFSFVIDQSVGQLDIIIISNCGAG